MAGRGRLVVLISGNGSNLQALLDACAGGRLFAEVALVVSNRRAAFGLERARAAGVEVAYMPLRPFRDLDGGRDAYDAALAARVLEADPDLVVLAGFMHILGPAFLSRFGAEQVINLHPALPGEFPGRDAIGDAHRACAETGLERTGVMVHFVVEAVDAGPVIRSELVPLVRGESVEELRARVHAVEHPLLVSSVSMVLEQIQYRQRSTLATSPQNQGSA